MTNFVAESGESLAAFAQSAVWFFDDNLLLIAFMLGSVFGAAVAWSHAWKKATRHWHDCGQVWHEAAVGWNAETACWMIEADEVRRLRGLLRDNGIDYCHHSGCETGVDLNPETEGSGGGRQTPSQPTIP